MNGECGLNESKNTSVYERVSLETPLVSIVCIAFNHGKYIGRAIEGFVCQQTNFPFEIIIHDDASVDDTLEVVREYQSRYPHLITVVAQSTNVFSKGVSVPTLAYGYAKGRFIAYCEGDDYWTDADKIQKQADYLLAHRDCGLVFTNAEIFYDGINRRILGRDRSGYNFDQVALKKRLITANPFITCTCMFLADAVKGYGKVKAIMEDKVMWLHISQSYRIWWLSDVTATYRVHSGGISRFVTLSKAIRFRRSAYRVNLHFNKQFGFPISKKMLKDIYRKSLLEFCIENCLFAQSARYYGSLSEYAYLVGRFFLKKAYIAIVGMPWVFELMLNARLKYFSKERN